jgi:2'-5' RNA ligase
VFVAVSEGISNCEVLAGQVRQGPLDQKLSFPYHPHVTVAHDVPEPLLDRAFAELADFECRFEVDDFHLYIHDERDGWRPTRDFSLRPTARR